ncbi:hypothetical protein [uncultured Moraxella sp.]|uniref:hypothetical protein n=1 Tax=uncultured Moraxella sp. TaxID=263769 RepID=UPI0025FA538A|nr:hypothetical protein [uncultured Moraxella sp.]
MSQTTKYIPPSAVEAMASTALSFSDEVVKSTDPLLIDIFHRIYIGELTHEEAEAMLIHNFLTYGTIDPKF